MLFFFFKQKTAYEWRISDWSSDVCSSDLVLARSVQAESAPPPLRLGGFAAKSRCLPHRGGGKRRTILRTLWYQCNFAIERPSALARNFTDSSLRVSALAMAFSAMPFFASVWSLSISAAVQGCLSRSNLSFMPKPPDPPPRTESCTTTSDPHRNTHDKEK